MRHSLWDQMVGRGWKSSEEIVLGGWRKVQLVLQKQSAKLSSVVTCQVKKYISNQFVGLAKEDFRAES